LTDQKLNELQDYIISSQFDETEKAVLRYADAMTKTPAEIPDEIFEKIKEYFNNEQIVELTSAIAWENYRARFDHALKIESQEFSSGEYCPLPVTKEMINNPENERVKQ
tara:strand:- start:1906 stop:2232 length:327 start_codon:yes stop_codon:yes gene_type:complete